MRSVTRFLKTSQQVARRRSLAAISITLAALVCLPGTVTANQHNPMIKLTTTMGDITLELFPDQAPTTVKNFVDYVEAGFFDGLIFHRVINGFMIQGGGFTSEMQQKAVGDPITNEADNGLKNEVGTVAMARTSDPHSATAQFFINLENNEFLNHTGKNPQGWGYAVFGKVSDGIDVVKAIGNVGTGNVGPYGDVPLEPVVIEKAEVVSN
jgi:peptidyl-prolyl cis-trans isomerase B (cyclophilin B)